MSNFEDVKKFMKTFDQRVITKPQFPDEKTMNLRFDLIKEELNELKQAMNEKNLKEIALSKGFLIVSSSPLTRSSYHADEDFAEMKKLREEQYKCRQPQ